MGGRLAGKASRWADRHTLRNAARGSDRLTPLMLRRLRWATIAVLLVFVAAIVVAVLLADSLWPAVTGLAVLLLTGFGPERGRRMVVLVLRGHWDDSSG
jgi:hypothetical protein